MFDQNYFVSLVPFGRSSIPGEGQGSFAAPFAGIIRSRFHGSAALPRRPLSLCPQSQTGWLPV